MARAKDATHDLNELPRCMFCGGSADAVHDNTVGVCLQCARERPAQLLADAIGNRLSADREDCEKAIAEHLAAFELHFWKAISANLCRVLHEWQEAHAGGLS
jgi:hypothetical protein